jgi:hypothetical protein
MVSAAPNLPSPTGSSVASVKEATPDIAVDGDFVRRESAIEINKELVNLYFEQISAQEIITIARHDTVNGQTSAYQPIRNLSQLGVKYGPQTIIPIQSSSKAFFNNFAIKLEDYIPDVGTGVGGLYVYVDSDNSIVIELVGLAADEQVELQILSSGDIINDTIY